MTESQCDQLGCTEPVTWVMNCQRGWLPSCEKHSTAYTTIGESFRIADVLVAVEQVKRLHAVLIQWGVMDD